MNSPSNDSSLQPKSPSEISIEKSSENSSKSNSRAIIPLRKKIKRPPNFTLIPDTTTPRSGFSFVLNPRKLVIPFTTHRMEGDMFLYEMRESNKEEAFGILGNLNSCKQPMLATHDKVLKAIQFKVESYETVFTPIELMVQRLNSLNDLYAHQLAETMKYYGMSLDFMKQISLTDELPAKNHPAHKEYQKKIKDTFDKYNETGCIFTTKTKFLAHKKRFEVVEIGFNERFVRYIGDSNEKFIKNTMKTGFPDVVSVTGNYHEWHSQVVQMSGSAAQNTENKPLTCVFWANHKKTPINCRVVLESHCLKMENYIENFLFFVCIPQENDMITPMEIEIKESQYDNFKKEVLENDFIKQFYPEVLKR